MGKTLHVLIVENSEDDALTLIRKLEQGGFKPAYERVESAAAMHAALRKKSWDIVVSGERAADFSCLDALAILKETGLDIPFIIFSGTIGEEMINEALKAGAKDSVGGRRQRIVPTVERELRDATLRRERRQAEDELRGERDIAERLAGEMAVIAEIGRLIGSTLNIDEVYEQFAAEAKKLIPFDRISVSLKNSGEDVLDIAYVSGIDVFGRRLGDKVPLSGSISEKIMRTRTSETFHPSSLEEIVERYSEDTATITFRAGMKSMIGVPLIARDEVIGVLNFRSTESNAYTEADLRLAERIGEQIAGAIANAQLYNRLEETKTSLRQSAGEFRLLVENGPEAIFITARGCFAYVNPAAVLLYGADSPAQLLGRPVLEFVHPDQHEVIRERIGLIVRKGEKVPLMEQKYIRLDGSIVDVEATSVPFTYEGCAGALAFVRDITERKRVENTLVQSHERLRKALGVTVQAMAMTVEARDPYTAGHQRRVSDLARSIAQEMRMTSDQVDGIRMAGMIHDIGKISVPAEILSKPTKLTEIEFNLIQVHAEAAFDILKDIEFPWPIAEIIHQHHERIDGSGYPQGLKGKEIRIEARILAVADVVEAMASHRPYRPSRGLNVAFAEITANRARLYDERVVDACLKIFTAGYNFPTI